MEQDEYDKAELPAIQQLQQLGWEYLHGAKLAPGYVAKSGDAPERNSEKEVVLLSRLQKAVRRINHWINDDNLDKVMREALALNTANLMEANKAIYDRLTQYLSVEQDLGQGRKGQTVKLIDFDHIDNNEFLVVNQFKVAGPNQKIIPDLVLFVNGLPLAVIECKSPYITNPMAEGIKQLRRYANQRMPENDEGAEKLFWYNQLMVSTHRDGARLGTISSRSEHYLEWKDAYPHTDADVLAEFAEPAPARDNVVQLGSTAFQSRELPVAAERKPAHNPVPTPVPTLVPSSGPTSQQRLIAGVFDRANFLDLILNFTLFEPVDGRLIKKVARYQQFRAVQKVMAQLKNGKDRKEKSGVVWHTQGSGKSLTMVMLAVKMRRDPELREYKLVFITDRTQLDEQLSTTFANAQGETVYNASSVAELKRLLAKDSSDLVTAMVQKFQDLEKRAGKSGDAQCDNVKGDESFTNLNPSDKIIVLADEAHRTQFGGLAMTINAALPNAPKIGFTGTPLLRTQKMDRAFGGYIDEYRIQEAVADGATVQILYEGREAKTNVTAESLDTLFDEYFADNSEEERRAIKQKYGVERAILEAPARIRWICIDLLKHYREHIQPNGFKAMIVTGSRHAATLYKKMLDELEAPESRVIISGDHNDEQYIAQYTDKVAQKATIKNFTKPFGQDDAGTDDSKRKYNNVAFLIVKDMLLTGFDAPNCQVMYIDRQLKEHTLMQAIARVNRTAKNKERGFVVDYYGLSDNLKDAMDLFSSDDVEGSYYSLKDEIPKLKATHLRAITFFKGADKSDKDACILRLKDEETRAEFETAFKRFAKQMEIMLPDTSAAPFLPDLRFLGKVSIGARNLYRDEQLNIADLGAKVRKLVDEHIISTGVDPKIAPVDLLAVNFAQAVDQHRSPEAKASEIESAIKSHINVNLEEDPAYYRSLSLRLKDIIERTQGRWEEQAQLLMAFRTNIQQDHRQQAKALGMDETEFAFHNLLNEQVLAEHEDDVLPANVLDEIVSVTRSLVAMMGEVTQIVDFFSKQDQVKAMRLNIRRTLLETEHCNDVALIKAVQSEFLELAQTKFGKV